MAGQTRFSFSFLVIGAIAIYLIRIGSAQRNCKNGQGFCVKDKFCFDVDEITGTCPNTNDVCCKKDKVVCQYKGNECTKYSGECRSSSCNSNNEIKLDGCKPKKICHCCASNAKICELNTKGKCQTWGTKANTPNASCTPKHCEDDQFEVPFACKMFNGENLCHCCVKKFCQIKDNCTKEGGTCKPVESCPDGERELPNGCKKTGSPDCKCCHPA